MARDVSGSWTIQQSNGWRTDVTLTQNGSELSGDRTDVARTGPGHRTRTRRYRF